MHVCPFYLTLPTPSDDGSPPVEPRPEPRDGDDVPLLDLPRLYRFGQSKWYRSYMYAYMYVYVIMHMPYTEVSAVKGMLVMR